MFFAGGADARRTTPLARAAGDKLARLGHEQVMCAEERFAEADPARIGVVKIKVRLKVFLARFFLCVFSAFSAPLR
jgi:hypothetical protein